MKHALLALSSLLLSAFAAGAAGNTCLTDTNQIDFQAGVAAGVDLTTSAGNVLLGTSSSGSGTVDQESLTYTQYGDEFNTTQWLAQTFTPSVSGSLTRVDLNFVCGGCSGTPPLVKVTIRATSGGLPVGSELASANIAFSTVGTPKFYSAIFSPAATLTKGTQYAIVVRFSAVYAGGLALFTDSAKGSFTGGNDVYAGGGLLISTNSGGTWTPRLLSGIGIDGVFMTYMGSGGGGYLPSGNLTSSAKDSSPGTGSTNWSALTWTDSAPAGTAITFQAAASNASTGPFNFVGPDGTSGSFFTASGASLSQFNGNRYLKYRAYLSTSSSTATPTLNDATACYSTVATADLSISNTDGAATVSAGGTTTYTLVAGNNGPSNVTGAIVTDAFPSTLTCTWTCSASSGSACPASGSGNISSSVNLLVGGTATFSASCAVSAAATGSIINTASISAPNGVTDPTTANNTVADTDSVGVAASPPSLSMTDNIDFVRVGDVVSYVIHVSNPGTSIAPTITDTLPAQLSGVSWNCSAGGGATCGSANGSGNTLTDTPTLPAGGVVDYTYTATVLAANSNGEVSNTASMKITGHASSMSVSDADTVVVFISGFEGATTPLAISPTGSSATGSVTAQFGVDGSLLAKLGPAPVTVASAQSATGKSLFSLQLMRSGNDLLLRSLTTIDGGPFSDVSPWQVVDLRALRLGFEWQSATTRGDDGYLRGGSTAQQALIAANNSREVPTQLQVAVVNGIPWLELVRP